MWLKCSAQAVDLHLQLYGVQQHQLHQYYPCQTIDTSYISFLSSALPVTRSYAHFCNCGKQLDSRFEALGGQRFADRVDVHKEDLPAIDTWLAVVTSALKGMQLKTVADLGGLSPHLQSCSWTRLPIESACMSLYLHVTPRPAKRHLFGPAHPIRCRSLQSLALSGCFLFASVPV